MQDALRVNTFKLTKFLPTSSASAIAQPSTSTVQVPMSLDSKDDDSDEVRSLEYATNNNRSLKKMGNLACSFYVLSLREMQRYRSFSFMDWAALEEALGNIL